MSLDIKWTIEVQVPQLDTIQQTLLTLGDKVVASIQGISEAIDALASQQASGSEAIATQLTVIADEISQLNAESLEQADLDALAQRIRDAAAVAEQQAADIRANSASISGMVPDEPVP